MNSPYSVILTDPPWHYNSRKTGGERCNKTKFGGGASKHYPLMRDSELLDMAPTVRAWSADNCACFMWATMPRLDFGIYLLKAWGFKYRTVAFTWIKTRRTALVLPIYGPGYYTASNAEIVLLGVKGRMRPTRRMTPSVILYPRLGHSIKPNIHQEIEAMYPEGRKLEMFARRHMLGWDCWGNEMPCDIEFEAKTEVLTSATMGT